jgi:hypothetical protein
MLPLIGLRFAQSHRASPSRSAFTIRSRSAASARASGRRARRHGADHPCRRRHVGWQWHFGGQRRHPRGTAEQVIWWRQDDRGANRKPDHDLGWFVRIVEHRLAGAVGQQPREMNTLHRVDADGELARLIRLDRHAERRNHRRRMVAAARQKTQRFRQTAAIAARRRTPRAKYKINVAPKDNSHASWQRRLAEQAGGAPGWGLRGPEHERKGIFGNLGGGWNRLPGRDGGQRVMPLVGKSRAPRGSHGRQIPAHRHPNPSESQ